MNILQLFEFFVWILLLILIYFFISAIITFILANLPRIPVNDFPNWGNIEEHWITAINGKKMECWVVYPDKLRVSNKKENPAIILLHGWGRSRGRMVSRARIYANYGYTTILFSARDHGNSEKEITGMSIVRFSQDLNTCVDWWGKPVILCAHSIGAGAALLVAAKNQLVRSAICEAVPFSFPIPSLYHVYRPILKWFTPLLIPGITFFTLIKFYNYSKVDYSPFTASKDINVPILLIHGKKDAIFPYKNTLRFKEVIKNCKIWIPDHTTHSNIEEHPNYENKVIRFLDQLNR